MLLTFLTMALGGPRALILLFFLTASFDGGAGASAELEEGEEAESSAEECECDEIPPGRKRPRAHL